MTIWWLIYGIMDEFKPIDKQKLIGEASAGYCILFLFALLFDSIVLAILYGTKIIK
jgi:hypothetical protein